MKKFLVSVITLILAMCMLISGCATTITNPADSSSSGGTSTSSGGSSSGSSGSSSDVPDSAYTVTLLLPEGETVMPDLDGIQAKWSNSTSVYTADFDSDGFAYCDGLDGDYTVTISGTLEDYGYNPNIYSTSSGKDVEIQLIAVQSFASGNGSTHYDGVRYVGNAVGLYRFEFTYSGQEVYFEFMPSITTTGYTFSVETYCDITENEITPTFSLMWWSNRQIESTVTGGSDYNGSYTKNIYYEVDMSTYTAGGHNKYIYVFSINSIDNDYSEVKYLDIYINREREYTDDDYWEDVGGKYTEATLEDYNSNYTVPNGEIKWISDLISDSSYAYQYDFSYFKAYSSKTENSDEDGYWYDDDEGYWYFKWQGEWYLLFVELKSCHYPAAGENGYSKVIYNFNSSSLCSSTKYYYSTVIATYLTTATAEGYHPVTSQLKTFLYDYSAGNLFNDYKGTLETFGQYGDASDGYANFSSNDSNQWLFACGIYMQTN